LKLLKEGVLLVSGDEINKKLKERKNEKVKDKKTDNRGYLVCDNCVGYYELQKGELASDFDLNCACGGKLVYSDSKEVNDADVNNKVVFRKWK
jgi:transcription initiation factor IIE alpha subunit